LATRDTTTPRTFGYGDAITWAFRSNDWLGQVVVMSLIALIPFVGAMALAGWALTAADNLHGGSDVVPPAGFYLRRGARVFFVAFVWGLAASVLIYGSFFAMFFLFANPQILRGALFGAFVLVWFAVVFGFTLVTHLAFVFIVPGAIEADSRGAIRGLNPVHAVTDVVRHPKDSILAGLITYLGWIVASLGASLCYIGILLTLGYGALIFAGALYVYERNTKIRTT
jgi:Protein of unknown function (DUF4013)